MSKLRIEQLDPIKLPLVARLYKAHYPSGKAKKNEQIIVGYLDNELISVVRMRSIESYRLLTGMLVSPEQQGRGYGHQLLEHCQSQVLQDNDFCFAYSHLETFYTAHQFKKIVSESLPPSLSNLYQRYAQTGKKLIPMRFLTKCSSHQEVC